VRVSGLSVAAAPVLAVTAQGETAWGEAKDGLKLGIEYVSGADGGVVRVLVRNVSSIPRDPEAGHEGLGGVREFAQFWAARSDGAGDVIKVFDRAIAGIAPSILIPVGLYVGAGETRAVEFPVKDLFYFSGRATAPLATLLRQGCRLRVTGLFWSGLLRLETPWISAGGGAGR
jgi:hypothetical protein